MNAFKVALSQISVAWALNKSYRSQVSVGGFVTLSTEMIKLRCF